VFLSPEGKLSHGHFLPNPFQFLFRFDIQHVFLVEPACGISIEVAKKAVKDWMSKKHQEYWESLTGLTSKGTYTRALCQKNEGSVKT
jgi:hypothetical protein